MDAGLTVTTFDPRSKQVVDFVSCTYEEVTYLLITSSVRFSCRVFHHMRCLRKSGQKEAISEGKSSNQADLLLLS
jgi:hypothetical protein